MQCSELLPAQIYSFSLVNAVELTALTLKVMRITQFSAKIPRKRKYRPLFGAGLVDILGKTIKVYLNGSEEPAFVIKGMRQTTILPATPLHALSPTHPVCIQH